MDQEQESRKRVVQISDKRNCDAAEPYLQVKRMIFFFKEGNISKIFFIQNVRLDSPNVSFWDDEFYFNISLFKYKWKYFSII